MFLSTKKVIYAGKPDVPQFENESKIMFHYQAELSQSHVIIDDTRKSWPHGYGQPLELILGKKFKVLAWETCLQTMRINEVASFVLGVADIMEYPFVSKQLRDISKSANLGPGAAEAAHCHSTCGGMAAQVGLGYPELDNLLEHPEPIKFTFELLSVSNRNEYEAASWQLDSTQKLASLPGLREKGNAEFKEGRYEDACSYYGQALDRIEKLLIEEKPGEPEFLELDVLKIPFYLNIAQCKLKLEDYYAAIKACDEIIPKCHGPALEKALFRRAKAHAGAWNFDEARKDLNHLKEKFPNQLAYVTKEIASLQAAESKNGGLQDDKLRKLFGK